MKKKLLAVLVIAVLLTAGVAVYASVTSSISYTPTASSATLIYTDSNVDVVLVTTTYDIVTETVDEYGNPSSSIYQEEKEMIERFSKTLAGHNYLAGLGYDHYYAGTFYQY